jgi:ketosteroid isomerase-like protein
MSAKETSAMPSDTSERTKDILNHHLQAVYAGDVDALLSDFTERSVLLLPDGPIRGLEQLRQFFSESLHNKPTDWLASFKMIRQDVQGDVAFIAWSDGAATPFGTDTLVIRDGKIAVQTRAVYQPT